MNGYNFTFLILQNILAIFFISILNEWNRYTQNNNNKNECRNHQKIISVIITGNIINTKSKHPKFHCRFSVYILTHIPITNQFNTQFFMSQFRRMNSSHFNNILPTYIRSEMKTNHFVCRMYEKDVYSHTKLFSSWWVNRFFFFWDLFWNGNQVFCFY